MPGRARRSTTALCLVVALAAGCARARPETPTRPRLEPLQQLRQDVADAIAAPGVARGTWGIAVRSLARDESLLEMSADALLVPASTAKLVTLAAAAEAVGWDYRFETTLAAVGTIADGVLTGDLVVSGTGDPTIGGPAGEGLDAWIAALRARGITRITGRIVGDDGGAEEPRPRFAWAWDDLGYPYGALPGALNLDENATPITLSPAPRPGLPAILDLGEASRELPVISDVTTGLAESLARVQPILQPGGLGLRLLGSLPAGSDPITFRVAVGNPTLWFVTMLRQRLREEGIAVEGAPVDLDNLPEGIAAGPVTRIHTHVSPPLAAIAEPMLKDSLNLYAETTLWLATGTGGPRLTDEALDALRARLEAWGVPDDGYQLVDGSGLSRRSTLTARTLVTILERLYDPADASPWMRAFPVAGRDGTLDGRLAGSPAEGTVRAKTGSMSNIRALAGYARTRDGEPLAFAILVNNFEGSGAEADAAIDRIVVALAGFSR